MYLAMKSSSGRFIHLYGISAPILQQNALQHLLSTFVPLIIVGEVGS